MYFIVAGCGRVGSQLAQFLSYEAHDVVVIDKDADSFRRLGGTFNGITLEGVAFDEELLLDAGIEQADAFAAVTNFDNTNLMASEIASSVYQVPTVISRLYNTDKELTFFKMGVDYVCSTTLTADRIKEQLFQGEELIVQEERLDIGIEVLEFVVPENAGGRVAGDLTSGVSSKLVALLRGSRAIDLDESTPLEAGDHALLSMRREGWNAVRDCLGDSALLNPVCRNFILPRSPDAVELLNKDRKAKVIVGGCSAVGAHLAFLLCMEDHDVTVIDESPEKFKRLPAGFTGRVLEGVTYDEVTLEEAGVEHADAFMAVTKRDNMNLMAAEVARHVYGVPHVIARLFNTDKEQTYQALGMRYVCGTRLLAQAMLERMLKPVLRSKGSCFNNLYDIVEFECPDGWDGRTVESVREKSGIRFAHVTRRSTGHLPDERFVLRAGDTITVVGRPVRLQKFEKSLRKMLKG